MSLSLSLHAASLIVIYSLYGYFQEKIMRSSTYGPDHIHFTSSALLILFNRVFSISVGLIILWLRSGKRGAPAFSRRLRPASSIYAYAAVALCNFCATTCQYEALKYVSYTTQSLAKCAKMIPVLLIGALIWKKTYKSREWVAGAVIVAGCGTYLFAQPPRTSRHTSTSSDSDSFESALIGTIFLIAFLFFDGLVSTAQERVFGKNPTSSDPFGPESPVLDQMIWTNFFAAGIAIVTALLSNATGTLMPNVKLLLTTPALVMDVCLLSATSAIGLIILLNTISSFGALNSSLIMTTRQFLSILLNAGLFGNFGSVSPQGWCGVGWVASGIYIKMNRAYDVQTRPTSPQREKSEERIGDSVLEKVLVSSAKSNENVSGGGKKSSSGVCHQYFHQYCLPLLIPVVAILFLSPLLSSPFPTIPISTTHNDYAIIPSVPSPPRIPIEGGKWDNELHDAVDPICDHNIEPVPYASKTFTGFVSFPRSGNSYIRSLIERSTGFQTSSVYCDEGLQKTFKGECDHDNLFFVKTHFPALNWYDGYETEKLTYYKAYDQVFHLIRNPLDAVASWWHLSNTPKTAEGNEDHEGKVAHIKFGQDQRTQLIFFAKKWAEHAEYWQQAPILTHTLRYEDLKLSPVPAMMSLLAFLLPEQDQPSLNDLACMVETDHTHEAYASQRSSDFASWSHWDDDLRLEVLELTKRPFCSFGYDKLLQLRVGSIREMEGFCDTVQLEEPKFIAPGNGTNT